MSHVYWVLRELLDMLFPPRMSQLLVRNISTSEIFKTVQVQSHNGICTLLPYQEANVKALIHEAKFFNNRKAVEILAMTIQEWSKATFQPAIIFIPIPLSHKRKKERGYNQVEEILKQIKNLNLRTDILIRNRHTTPQTELTREERLNNIKNAFAVAKPNSLTGKHVVIVDDVLTTGATLNEAKATLLPHNPATITCLAIAH